MNNNISYHPTALVDASISDLSKYQQNPLFNWMCSLSSYSKIEQFMFDLFQRYKVGVMPNDSVIYWQHDIEGQCRAGKVMKYDNTGHRVKKYGAQWIHSLMGVDDFHLQQVPFGLHLLPSHPINTSVAVVESEKTALLAAAYHTIYFNNESRLPLFIATGGAGNLKNTLKYLKGRHVVIFPDEDQTIEWSKIASQHGASCCSISINTTVRQYVIDGTLPPKSDYGDLLEFIQKGYLAELTSEPRRVAQRCTIARLNVTTAKSGGG